MIKRGVSLIHKLIIIRHFWDLCKNVGAVVGAVIQ